MNGLTGPSFLLLEDDLRIGAALRRTIGRSADVVWVTSVGASRLALASRGFAGLVLDVMLPDGSGLTLLRDLRRAGISAPALVITGSADRQLANTCYALSAACVYKPSIDDHVDSFVRRTLARTGSVQERVVHAVAQYAVEHGLTKRERDLVELAALGVSREGLAAELHVTENTVKTHVRRLLGRCGESKLDDVVRAVLATMLEASTN